MAECDTLHPDATLTFDEDGLNLLSAFGTAATMIDVWKRDAEGSVSAIEVAQHSILHWQSRGDPFFVLIAASLKTAFGQ